MKFRSWLIPALLTAFSTLAALLPASPLIGSIDRVAAAGPELAIDADIANGGPCATVDSRSWSLLHRVSAPSRGRGGCRRASAAIPEQSRTLGRAAPGL